MIDFRQRDRRVAIAGMLTLIISVLAPLNVGQARGVPTTRYTVRAIYPHDSGAYTEGLFYLDGRLFESTGLEGRSDIRQVRLHDGAVLLRRSLEPDLFGEGIVNWGSEILSLTWRNEIGFRWDLATLKRKSNFSYTGEGWGLTQDGKTIVMSDGTPVLRFLEPTSLKVVRRLNVTAAGLPVENLNELEWVNGEILANVWLTNRIARIDPQTGIVKAWIDLSSLPEAKGQRNADAVLNGIAFDAQGGRLFVTGKNWPHLYEIKLHSGGQNRR